MAKLSAHPDSAFEPFVGGMEIIHPVTLIDQPTYMTTYEWEKFNLDGWRRWVGKNWHFTIYAAIAYVIFIFTTQYVMRDRKPFRLTGILTTWNSVLAVFSIVAFLRTVPEFIHVLTSPNGFHNSVCHWTSHNHATAFWSWLLLISKVIELGDTVFVVLRKQNLLFLHWYHHVTTLLSWWVMYLPYEPNQLWYIVMNSFIHGRMYSYYALKALGFRVPRNFAMFITTLQLVQMFFGIAVNIYALNLMWLQGRGNECDRGYFGLKVSFGIYVPYFILFAQFFYKSYFGKNPTKGKGPAAKGTPSSKSSPIKAKKID